MIVSEQLIEENSPTLSCALATKVFCCLPFFSVSFRFAAAVPLSRFVVLVTVFAVRHRVQH